MQQKQRRRTHEKGDERNNHDAYIPTYPASILRAVFGKRNRSTGQYLSAQYAVQHREPEHRDDIQDAWDGDKVVPE